MSHQHEWAAFDSTSFSAPTFVRVMLRRSLPGKKTSYSIARTLVLGCRGTAPSYRKHGIRFDLYTLLNNPGLHFTDGSYMSSLDCGCRIHPVECKLPQIHVRVISGSLAGPQVMLPF
jgi:hypothetical protein